MVPLGEAKDLLAAARRSLSYMESRVLRTRSRSSRLYARSFVARAPQDDRWRLYCHANLPFVRLDSPEATHRLPQAGGRDLRGRADGARGVHGDVVSALSRASADDGEVRQAD